MNRKQFLLTLLLAVISAFLGGALSVWFLMPQSVLAQDEPGVIEAREFRVVDYQGRLRGTLGYSYLGPSVMLYDRSGTKRLALEVHNVLGSYLTLHDRAGTIRAEVLVADPSSITGNPGGGIPGPPRRGGRECDLVGTVKWRSDL